MYKINFIYFCKYVDTISPNNKFNNTINFFIKFCFISLTHIQNKKIQVHKELESLAFLLYNIGVEINKKKELLKR